MKSLVAAALMLGILVSNGHAADARSFNAWVSASAGLGVQEYESQLLLGLHLELATEYGGAVFAARHTRQAMVFRDHLFDWAVLVGTSLRGERFVVVPKGGLGLAWGSQANETDLLSSTKHWGPDPALALELQVFHREHPWIGFTLYGTRSSTDGYGGLALTFRFGRVPSDT